MEWELPGTDVSPTCYANQTVITDPHETCKRSAKLTRNDTKLKIINCGHQLTWIYMEYLSQIYEIQAFYIYRNLRDRVIHNIVIYQKDTSNVQKMGRMITSVVCYIHA